MKLVGAVAPEWGSQWTMYVCVYNYWHIVDSSKLVKLMERIVFPKYVSLKVNGFKKRLAEIKRICVIFLKMSMGEIF